MEVMVIKSCFARVALGAAANWTAAVAASPVEVNTVSTTSDVDVHPVSRLCIYQENRTSSCPTYYHPYCQVEEVIKLFYARQVGHSPLFAIAAPALRESLSAPPPPAAAPPPPARSMPMEVAALLALMAWAARLRLHPAHVHRFSHAGHIQLH